MSPRRARENRCRHCSRVFARAEHLVRHERTHTKEKPFACQRCAQTFSRRDLLNRHMKKSHESVSSTAEWDSSGALEHSQPCTTDGQHASEGLVMPFVPAQGDSPLSNSSVPSVPLTEPTPLNPAPWSSNVPWFLDYSLGSNVHDYVMPVDMTWPDDTSGSDRLAELNFVDIQQRFFPEENYTAAGLDAQPCPPAHAALGDQSMLSRLTSPAPQQVSRIESAHPEPGVSLSGISDQYWRSLQELVRTFSEFHIPARATLDRFVQVYFRTFHRHQPFLHKGAWKSDSTSPSLFLAVCANGALYSLESETAYDLYIASSKLVENEDSGLVTLQTLMLVIAFAVWSGKREEIAHALRLQTRLAMLLPRYWNAHKSSQTDAALSWHSWLAHEQMQRVTSCLFTLCNLMTLTYDFPSPIRLEAAYGLPSKESLWSAQDESAWTRKVHLEPSVRRWTSVEAIVDALGDPSQECPREIGMFACHVVISTLLQKIMLLRRSCSSTIPGFKSMRHYYIECLRRWQAMWDREPEASLSPDSPAGPMLFNCTALLRVAYIRLVADFAPLRSVFAWTDVVEDIEQRLHEMAPIRRNSYKTRAVLHASLALKIPVNVGFEVTARSGFWTWSVQHALCYFECALLLAQWLLVVQHATDLDEEEKQVLGLVHKVVEASESNRTRKTTPNLAVGILQRWARLLNTGPVTVWNILPKMAGVLTYYAEKLIESDENYQR